MHVSSGSTQKVFALAGGEIVSLDLPGPWERLGRRAIRWGTAEVPLTPAYWAAQSWMWGLEEPEHFRLGRTLAEEMLACILGGYGIPAEVGLAAYERLRLVLRDDPRALDDADRVRSLLTQPLRVAGRSVRYRFANQKAGYISEAFRRLPDIDETLPDRRLRDRLTELRGFGPKTASWIVRNWRASDEVAILDIHILRAGMQLGIFPTNRSVERHYSELEDAYLDFAADLGVRASILDSVMWMTIRQLPRRQEQKVHRSTGQRVHELPLLRALV
jgi:hypothetical protein